ncbi:hypothetical protein Tco_0625359 [Tanacetum coccineum]|uniref:Uncharacterized protein n=1 Tax=Tanacetum coccineum TaxID=301880 RepID=A0ABQ4WGL8_9ASTR
MGEVSRLSSKNWYKEGLVGVKAPISTMIVSVPEKDRWCGTRGKFMRDVIVDGGGMEDIKHDTSVDYFYYKTQGHVTTVFELQRHQGDQDVDAKEMVISFNDIGCDKNISKVEGTIWIRDLYMTRMGHRCEMKGEKLLQYPYTIADHEKP